MKYYSRSLFSLLFILLSFTAFTQNPGTNQLPRCGHDLYRNHLETTNPALLRQRKQNDRDLARKLRARQGAPNGQKAIMEVPVVVHVIHQNGPENIPDAVILAGLQHMNDAFANVGAYDPQTGAVTEIRFCLARRDPSGNATTGIVRVQDALTNMTMETQDGALKSLSNFDPFSYLNIWLVNEITSVSQGSGVAGYATLPALHGQNGDGIVVEARWFGSSTDNSVVAVHEAGHYFGLYHTFEGGCTNNDCLTDGDHVCDTPPDGSTAGVPCTSNPNTCSTDEDDLSANNPFRPVANGGLGDQPDMISNYMDYGFFPCMNAFTQGQSDRMSLFLSGARSTLLTSAGCQPACPNPSVAAFSSSVTQTTIGTPVSFTFTGSGATTFEWKANGSTFSTQQNPSQSFTTPGLYEITLVTGNGQNGCQDSTRSWIDVRCTLQALFSASDDEVLPGDTVIYTQQAPGSLSYEWLVDGVSAGTGNTLTQIYTDFGGRNVCLITDNGQCRDTNCIYVPVGDCGRKRANIWQFGFWGNSLDFSTNPPTPSYGTLYGFSEGCASICDANGKFVMATDGFEVEGALGSTPWNGTPMPNGDSLWGGQGHSSTQSSIIIPKPLDDSTYYIFTADEAAGWPYYNYGGIAYSEVDLRVPGNFGSAGDVVSKNNPLWTPACEKLAAVRHANGCDIWVVGHAFGSDEFLAWRVTDQGVDPSPVISRTGFPHVFGYLNSNTPAVVNTQGQMKISPDGTKIAVAIQDTSVFEVLEFDKSTGRVGNSIFMTQITPIGFNHTYGVEFSPDGSKLYGAHTFASPSRLVQYDLNAGSSAQIAASVQTLASFPTGSLLASLQLAPNGKIYGALYNSANLLVINNPNASGTAAGVVTAGQPLQNPTSHGLPGFMADYASVPEGRLHGPLQPCVSAPAHYYFDQFSCEDSIIWDLPANLPYTQNPDGTIDIVFANASTYTLKALARTACGVFEDSITVTSVAWTPPNLGPDTAICSGANLQLSPGSGYTSYEWQDGSTASTFSATQPGSYWVEVEDGNGCGGTDTISIAANNPPPPTVDLGPDTSVCKGGVVFLDAGPGNYAYRWQDFSTNQTNTAWNPGTFWVEVTDVCGQTTTDTINITLDNSLQINLGADTVICDDETILLDAGAGFFTYLWQDGSNQSQFTVTQPGTYHVEVTDANGCSATDTIKVDECVSVEGLLGELSCKLYPNPFSESVNLVFSEPAQEVKVRILDAMGREVKVYENGNGRRFTLNTSGLSTGFYAMEIRMGMEKVVLRMVKQ